MHDRKPGIAPALSRDMTRFKITCTVRQTGAPYHDPGRKLATYVDAFDASHALESVRLPENLGNVSDVRVKALG